MPAWATVTITLGASVIAVLGALAAAGIQLRHARREREEAEHARWREKGAEVVAPLQSLVQQAEPLRLGVDLEKWQERWLSYWERWDALHAQLTVFAASHPSDEIANSVAEVAKAVPQALSAAGWFVGGFVGPKGRTDGYDEAMRAAQSSHTRAADLTAKLLPRCGRSATRQ
jgi:hypothetical protein